MECVEKTWSDHHRHAPFLVARRVFQLSLLRHARNWPDQDAPTVRVRSVGVTDRGCHGRVHVDRVEQIPSPLAGGGAEDGVTDMSEDGVDGAPDSPHVLAPAPQRLRQHTAADAPCGAPASAGAAPLPTAGPHSGLQADAPSAAELTELQPFAS
jgi:hypothetical protein